MNIEEHTTRATEIGVLFLGSEIHNLNHLLLNVSLEHQLMLIAKWVGSYFLVEVTVFATTSTDSEIKEETESDLNISYLMLDGEDLDNVFETLLDLMPSIDRIGEDTNFDIRAHAGCAFQQMQTQVQGSNGTLRLGMDVNFNHGVIEFSRWTAFLEDEYDSHLSVIEEHKLFHAYETVSTSPIENEEIHDDRND